LQIDKEAEKVQKQIDGLAVSYKPDMAETEFVTRGTREYSQRRAARLAEYQKLISSPEYLKAMKDKETVDVSSCSCWFEFVDRQFQIRVQVRLMGTLLKS